MPKALLMSRVDSLESLLIRRSTAAILSSVLLLGGRPGFTLSSKELRFFVLKSE